jgi:hypothetical protein
MLGHPKASLRRATPSPRARVLRGATAGTSMILALLFQPASLVGAKSDDSPSGREIIEKVNQRNFGRSLSQRMTMRLIDADERVRERRLLSFRSFTPSGSHLAFYVTQPPDMRNMAYLVHDHFDPELDDDQWIFTPKHAAARRIAATNRRESFLGSEFSLEDVRKVFRIEVDDFEWEIVSSREVDGHTIYEVVQRPKTQALAKQLGVSRIRNWIDGTNWVRVKVDSEDLDGKPLRSMRIVVGDSGEEGPQVAKAQARNLQTGNATEIVFHDRSFDRPIADETFTLRGLQREDVARLERSFAAQPD